MESDRSDESDTIVNGVDNVDLDMDSSENESDITKRYLEWCRKHRFVKCIEYAVPDGILPKNYKGILIDIKVQGEKKYAGPDDKLYAAHEALRTNVARGNTVLELQHREGPRVISTTYIFLIFALRKFSGGMGDEDEDNSCQNMWQKYFIKPVESATKVIVTEKANGEAAHLSCRSIGGQTFFCLGSKNVHMLVRNQEDIQKYTDSRFLVARIVAEAFFRNYVDNTEIDTSIKEEFYRLMQTKRSTAIFELLQPKCQHIVDLSYLDLPELRFICWAENYRSESNEAGDHKKYESLCLVPPNYAIDEARALGIATIEYEIIDAKDAENYMAKIRGERDYEGKVLYFVDENDKVFGLIKKKTAWYIILRAIREKVCHFSCGKNVTSSKSEMQTKVIKRISEIQKWLEFSDEYRNQWNEMGKAFTTWAVHMVQGSSKNHFAVRSQFPQLWKQFLETNEKYQSMYEQLTYS